MSVKKIQDTFGPYMASVGKVVQVHTKNKMAVILGNVHCPVF
jgi:hypothetical protein